MAYRTIGLIVTDEVSDNHALQAAIGFCSREGAHLDVYCLGVDVTQVEMTPLGAAPGMSQVVSGQLGARTKELMAWVEAQLKAAPFPISVQALRASNIGLEAKIARVVRYCDLLVASQPYGPGSTALQVGILEAAVFGTGAPVLVVPRRDRDNARSFERLMVAWNESDESLEAVRKAMPALEVADRAEIVMVDPPVHSPERSDPGGAICVMLARHGVKAEVSILSKTMPRVSEVINRHAEDHQNDLIIMGAYGHSRFREALIGGATRDMLETAQVPVLMAH